MPGGIAVLDFLDARTSGAWFFRPASSQIKPKATIEITRKMAIFFRIKVPP